MAMTRGEFLRSLAVGAGTAVTGLTALGAQHGQSTDNTQAAGHVHTPVERSRLLAERLNKEAFAKNINTSFRIMDRESPNVVEAQLVEVRDGRSSSECEQFSLLFKGPTEPALPQRTYELEHREMGSFELFLVPIAADESGTTYEAVFNRMRT